MNTETYLSEAKDLVSTTKNQRFIKYQMDSIKVLKLS